MKQLSFLLFVIILMLCILPSIASAEREQPEIVLTYAPAYNVDEPFRGFVRGINDPSQYRVTLYLQISTDGEYWVKPTKAQPYVKLEAGGAFKIDYTSGGHDLEAIALHLLLLPADYAPTLHGFPDAKKEALDYVCVTRKSDGTIRIDPDRYYVGKTAACGPEPGKLLVDVGFYTDGSMPGQGLSIELITAQLNALESIASGIRIYAASGELYPAYKLAQDRGLYVFGTAYLSGDKSADLEEIDALIEHCNNGLAQVAIVGNETLLSEKLTEEQLLEYIAYVRAGIDDESIPVTTSDSIGYFIDSPRLLDACDILMPNIYPYWEGKSINVAAESFIADVESLQQLSSGKQVIVSETGWPTDGESNGYAEAKGSIADYYFETVNNWSIDSGTPVLWFEAADEPWKASAEGEVGAHWGLLTNELILKDYYAELDFFQSVDDIVP